MEYVHQIEGRATSNIVNVYFIVHKDGLQGRANDLMTIPQDTSSNPFDSLFDNEILLHKTSSSSN